jgi:sarcosine oxidase / L-pipecolate oxidase
MRGWLHDPVFKPFYHATGYVVAANSPEGLERLRKHEMNDPESNYEDLSTPAQFRKTMPDGVLTGDFPGWRGWYKSDGCGWAHARKALVSASEEAKRLGVKFVMESPAGKVTSLLYNDNDVVGAQTAGGQEHRAARTFLCTGANAPQILDVKGQLRPTAWTLAHIKMTPEESKLYRDLPVLFNIEKGFFMEPDEDNHELKICDEHPGYCNWVEDETSRKVSLPFAKHQIPLEAEERVRSFLQETMPQLADRPFAFARICWCADTPDRSFLICRHPDYPSLILGIGDSGHGYMHIPAIGGFIVDAAEGRLREKLRTAFGWRPQIAEDPNWVKDTLGRFGGPNKVMDLQKVKGWTNISNSRL